MKSDSGFELLSDFFVLKIVQYRILYIPLSVYYCII